MMMLFHWAACTCLRNYSEGDIIVMAPNLEAAQEKARKHAETYLKENREWWFLSDGTLDPDEQEDYAAWIQKLEADLAKEPYTYGQAAIFIRGSD